MPMRKVLYHFTMSYPLIPCFSIKFNISNICFNKIQYFIFYTILGHRDDEQMDCVAKLAPIVAMYAGHPDLLVYVEQIVRMTEDNDVAVAIGLAAARCIYPQVNRDLEQRGRGDGVR